MAFSPTSLSGLAAWYDAADAASITGATPVTQWADKSGNARHLTHASAGPDDVSGSQLMRFNGPASASAVGDFLDLPSMTMRTVFAFFKKLNPQSVTNNYHALFGDTASNTYSLYLDLPAPNTSSYGIRPRGTSLNKVSLNGGGWTSQATTSVTVPVAFTLNGDIVGVEYGTGATGLNAMGKAAGQVWRPNWDLAEVVVYDRVLTGSEKELVEGYLAHKWARIDLLPGGHPYKTIAPWTLVAGNAAHDHSASSPSLAAGGAIAVSGAEHAHSASQPMLSAHGLTLDDVTNHRIFQRISGQASVNLAGGYSGAQPAEIQARVVQGATVVLDWTALSAASITGGNWSGTLGGVPQGGMYSVQTRSRGSGGNVLATAAGTSEWGVGDIFAVIGSSTPALWFTDGSGAPDPLMREYDDGWLAGSTSGIAAITFANQAIADSGVPVALMDRGVSGSTLAEWHQTSYSGYAAFTAALAAVGGKIAGVIVHIGSNDARAEAIASQAQHEGRHRALIANIRADAGQPGLPVFLMGSARAPAEPASSDDYWGWARAAEHAVGEDANVHLASTVVDLPMAADNIHLSTAAMQTSAGRVARCAGAVLYGTGLEWRRPFAASARRIDDTHSEVTINHRGGTDFTPVIGITGFALSTDDFANLIPISAGVRQSANVIRLTHASTGGVNAKLRHQWGAAPDVTGTVHDNGALALPLSPGWAALDLFAGAMLDPDAAVLATTSAGPVLAGGMPPVALQPEDSIHFFNDELLLFIGTGGARHTLMVPADPRGLAITN